MSRSKVKSLCILILDKLAYLFKDELFLKIKFRIIMGYSLNLDNPKTFNEKLQWLKLYNRKPIYSKMVDKIDAKKYVADIIGKEYIIPTIAEYNNANEIDFASLPDQFVLKCTHDSGKVIICKNKADLNISSTRSTLNKALKCDYYNLYREWPYKNASRRIICERLMISSQNKTSGLIDYKFYCFNGVPKFLYVSEGLENHSTAKISFLTMDWEFAPFGRSDFKPFSSLPEKPSQFEQMKDIASKLSKGIPFLRVDLYEICGQIYFSELTFTPCSGFMPFVPKNYDKVLGDYISLIVDHAN